MPFLKCIALNSLNGQLGWTDARTEQRFWLFSGSCWEDVTGCQSHVCQSWAFRLFSLINDVKTEYWCASEQTFACCRKGTTRLPDYFHLCLKGGLMWNVCCSYLNCGGCAEILDWCYFWQLRVNSKSLKRLNKQKCSIWSLINLI